MSRLARASWIEIVVGMLFRVWHSVEARKSLVDRNIPGNLVNLIPDCRGSQEPRGSKFPSLSILSCTASVEARKSLVDRNYVIILSYFFNMVEARKSLVDRNFALVGKGYQEIVEARKSLVDRNRDGDMLRRMRKSRGSQEPRGSK